MSAVSRRGRPQSRHAPTQTDQTKHKGGRPCQGPRSVKGRVGATHGVYKGRASTSKARRVAHNSRPARAATRTQEGLARAKPSGSCMTGPTVGCRRTACGRHRHPRLRPGVRSSRLSGMIPWDCPHDRIWCHTIQSSLHSLVLGVICMGRARACEG